MIFPIVEQSSKNGCLGQTTEPKKFQGSRSESDDVWYHKSFVNCETGINNRLSLLAGSPTYLGSIRLPSRINEDTAVLRPEYH